MFVFFLLPYLLFEFAVNSRQFVILKDNCSSEFASPIQNSTDKSVRLGDIFGVCDQTSVFRKNLKLEIAESNSRILD